MSQPEENSLEDHANKAITCLYIAVDAAVADDVRQRVGAFICQLKRECDEAKAANLSANAAIADIADECKKYCEKNAELERQLKAALATNELRDDAAYNRSGL